MKKFALNVAFALVALALLAPNGWCSDTGHGPRVPDTASTSTLLGLVSMGFVGARKFLRR